MKMLVYRVAINNFVDKRTGGFSSYRFLTLCVNYKT